MCCQAALPLQRGRLRLVGINFTKACTHTWNRALPPAVPCCMPSGILTAFHVLPNSSNNITASHLLVLHFSSKNKGAAKVTTLLSALLFPEGINFHSVDVGMAGQGVKEQLNVCHQIPFQKFSKPYIPRWYKLHAGRTVAMLIDAWLCHCRTKL